MFGMFGNAVCNRWPRLAPSLTHRPPCVTTPNSIISAYCSGLTTARRRPLSPPLDAAPSRCRRYETSPADSAPVPSARLRDLHHQAVERPMARHWAPRRGRCSKPALLLHDNPPTVADTLLDNLKSEEGLDADRLLRGSYNYYASRAPCLLPDIPLHLCLSRLIQTTPLTPSPPSLNTPYYHS